MVYGGLLQKTATCEERNGTFVLVSSIIWYNGFMKKPMKIRSYEEPDNDGFIYLSSGTVACG